jgi:RNA polymerase sigma-70 factor (sigma-E family)
MDKHDSSAFDEFFAMTFQRVVGQVYLMTGTLAEVEDAVQDAYMRAWERWDRFEGYDQREAWIRLVAYRILVSGWRKAANRLTAHRRFEAPARVPDLSPDHIALVDALRKITVDQRRVVVLHHLVGLSVEEVAAETGTSAGTVKSRLARGRKALAALLADAAETLPGEPGARLARSASSVAAEPAVAREEDSNHA